MTRDIETQHNLREQDFKNLVFSNNPKLYKHIFVELPRREAEKALAEEQIRMPQTAGDVANLLADLKELGITLEAEFENDSAASIEGDPLPSSGPPSTSGPLRSETEE